MRPAGRPGGTGGTGGRAGGTGGTGGTGGQAGGRVFNKCLRPTTYGQLYIHMYIQALT